MGFWIYFTVLDGSCLNILWESRAQRKPCFKAYHCTCRACKNLLNRIPATLPKAHTQTCWCDQFLNGHTPQLLCPVPTKLWNKLLPAGIEKDGQKSLSLWPSSEQGLLDPLATHITARDHTEHPPVSWQTSGYSFHTQLSATLVLGRGNTIWQRLLFPHCNRCLGRCWGQREAAVALVPRA